jgi:glycosyltransferase involved in cell wall biosynthesis
MLEPWAWRHKWWKKHIYFQLIERRHLAGAARLVATSQTEASNLKQFFPESKCEVLPLGIAEAHGPDYEAARQSLGWKGSELIILFLSRVHPKKGLHLLLSALTKIQSQLSDRIRLVIVGDGRKRYVQKLRLFHEDNRSLLPRIDWIGEIWTEEKWKYLQGADLFCLPSYSENFGLAVVEALQVGTRVLTTDQTPWGDLPSWNAGWIAQPQADSLAKALAQYLANSEWTIDQRKYLAVQTRQRFSWEIIGPHYLRFYEDISRDNASPQSRFES